VKKSIIYENIYIYRVVMNLLYSLKYKTRFNDIVNLIKKSDKKVLELCFGDTIIAEECRKRNIFWTGYDINEYFIRNAKKKGLNAILADISQIERFPRADICIISGSLYHFILEIDLLLRKMLDASPKIIISEPIENLSSQKNIIGAISKILTNAGKGHENFRFDKNSIIEILNKYSDSHQFSYKIVSSKRDILIEISNDRN